MTIGGHPPPISAEVFVNVQRRGLSAEMIMGNSKSTPRLTEEEMAKLAVKTVQEFVNACHCQNEDDVLLALSFWLNVGMEAGELVQRGQKVVLQ